MRYCCTKAKGIDVKVCLMVTVSYTIKYTGTVGRTLACGHLVC